MLVDVVVVAVATVVVDDVVDADTVVVDVVVAVATVVVDDVDNETTAVVVDVVVTVASAVVFFIREDCYMTVNCEQLQLA